MNIIPKKVHIDTIEYININKKNYRFKGSQYKSLKGDYIAV